MQTKIQKWGNSLALRIPKAFAAQLGMEADTRVKIVIEEDHIAITKVEPGPITLERLLAGITQENLHGEVDAGKTIGKEIW